MSNRTTEMRFGFGKNWAEFVEKHLSEGTIDASRLHLADLLRTDDLRGMTFLDIGCGSGIHALAALRMGAEQVVSFDYDRDSVNTTQRVREHAKSPTNWRVMQGSVLDKTFMSSLPKADIVYSWGVLHHTGDMWSAIRNSLIPLKADGVYYIALYSSDNYVDPPPAYWMEIKKRYNLAGERTKRWMEWRYMLQFHFLPELRAGRNPFQLIRGYGTRGMTYWTDAKDWLGGWPMDFAGFGETRAFCRSEAGLTLANVRAGEGCTEYVFTHPEYNAHWRSIIDARAQVKLIGPFARNGGLSYSVALPHLELEADCAAAPRRSRLMLYEDGAALGLAHSMHAHIRGYGNGRFSHWGRNLFFSASDGSDPNTNGRAYAYCERF